MSEHSQSGSLPIDMLGILSCITDGVIVYRQHKVLFFNVEGHLLLEQTNQGILDNLQFKQGENNLHQVDINIPERNEALVAYCLHTRWEGEKASVAILKSRRDIDALSISPLELNEQNLEQRSRLDLLFRSAGDGYWDWHIPTANVFFSPGWTKMLGYSPQDIEPSFNAWINLIHPDDLGAFLISWTEYMENAERQFSIEYRIRCKNTKYRWVETHGIKDVNSQNETERLTGFHRDITRRKQRDARLQEYQQNLEQLVAKRTEALQKANSQLELLASQDPLTLLHNRRSFDGNLARQLLSAKRNATPLSLLLMDIDHFKAFNDAYGHQLGDKCLQGVATAIQKSIFRPNDIAARFGGEEFVVVLQDTDMQGAIKVAQNIQKNLKAIPGMPINPVSQSHLSVSIGISTNQQTSSNHLIELADKAMYAAKDNGRNQICHFGDDLKTVSYIINQLMTK